MTESTNQHNLGPNQSVAHVVAADWRARLTCPTLDPATLAKLQAAVKAPPWYRSRWTHPRFREGALRLLRSEIPAGFVINATNGRITAPPPFVEPFEPIELGKNDPQLKTLSGAEKTREEKIQWIALLIAGNLGAGLAVGLLALFLVGFIRGGSQRVGSLIVEASVVAVLIAQTIVVLITHTRGRWFLVPAGAAVVRRGGGRRPKVQVFSNDESIAVLRYISIGNSVTLVAELFSDTAVEARLLLERDAMSLMAAWQSPRVPPPPSAFAELAEQ